MFQAHKRPLVIAVAAVSGGGKTPVATSLTQQLPNAKALYFDDYDFEGPDDILDWVENGANYNGWNLTPRHRPEGIVVRIAEPCSVGLSFRLR